MNRLNELSEVAEADRVYLGPYDIVVKVQTDTIERFNKTLVSDIKSIDNIISAVTLIKNEDLDI
jgi:hypothetical protein